jgi:hypothetical protein
MVVVLTMTGMTSLVGIHMGSVSHLTLVRHFTGVITHRGRTLLMIAHRHLLLLHCHLNHLSKVCSPMQGDANSSCVLQTTARHAIACQMCV